jgi:hypothetical protein
MVWMGIQVQDVMQQQAGFCAVLLFGQESPCHIYLLLSKRLEYELSLYFTTSTYYHRHLPQPPNCV